MALQLLLVTVVCFPFGIYAWIKSFNQFKQQTLIKKSFIQLLSTLSKDSYFLLEVKMNQYEFGTEEIYQPNYIISKVMKVISWTLNGPQSIVIIS
jgi:hypothetical protein